MSLHPHCYCVMSYQPSPPPRGYKSPLPLPQVHKARYCPLPRLGELSQLVSSFVHASCNSGVSDSCRHISIVQCIRITKREAFNLMRKCTSQIIQHFFVTFDHSSKTKIISVYTQTNWISSIQVVQPRFLIDLINWNVLVNVKRRQLSKRIFPTY